ncbi:MAG TPA: SDR family NAD(P)-dependent oxidoreductase [Vineibacter sp.]|nr:SDR family NAD(P)-dependent oxidoreductase [Vineibacter sp.]
MESRMDGRVALITGASMGLGKAMALKFAGAGAKVALVARRPDVLAEAKAEVGKAGTKVEAYSCDVSDKAALEATWAKVVADFGQVDVLVNNAGASAAKPFESVTDAEWEADFAIKVWPAIRLCRLAFPAMKQRRWGRIINVLNTHAKAPAANSAPTSVSRAAGLALTKVLANEGAPHNVLVNALLVGLIDSDQWMRRYKQNPGTNKTYREFLDEFAKERGLRIGRMGEAEEFASAACFLASNSGSYINGVAINVDGGMSPVV